MENKKLLLNELIGKDEQKAQKAADYLINGIDIELYKMLIEKSDFLFPFVKENVLKRIEKSITKSNFKNIIKFFECYSSYYDDLFASILAKHANEDLTDEIFELLEQGTDDEKTYAAKYFSYIPDTVAIELLSKYAFSSNEDLSANAAEALGQMQDDVSFDISLNNLNSEDDFEKLKAVKFFSAYGRNYPFKEIFEALKTSKMPENIAGQIPYMESLMNLLESDYKEDTLRCIYYILLGLGEILPLSDVFQFELYDVLDKLIKLNSSENDFSAKISVILLNALSKFNMFNENDEYIFDEDKNTKQEITSILKLLNSKKEDFWNKQKQFVLKMLNGSDRDIQSALSIISEFNIKEAIAKLKDLLNTNNEVIICETLNTLKVLNALDDKALKSVLLKIQNPNIKAVIENMIVI